MKFNQCPRCGEHTYEKLKTHNHCVGCNYSPDEELEAKPLIPSWAKIKDPETKNLVSDLSIAFSKTA